MKELKERERYCHFFEIITSSDEFPQRVMHHDAKISNVLFHEKTGKVICPVDYDTVMPGYYFSDLGDMIRSMASAAEENQTAEPVIRKAFYEAIVTGYTDVLGGILTASERKYIHAAGLLMIYMQSLRFLTDYLNGDIYYQVSHESENLKKNPESARPVEKPGTFPATGVSVRDLKLTNPFTDSSCKKCRVHNQFAACNDPVIFH